MAYKSKKPESCDYQAEIKKLKASGPAHVYLLYGPETYLRDHFLETLRSIVIPDGDDGFSFRRFNGPDLNLKQLAAATDTMPFLSERSFIEIHDVNINSTEDSDALSEIIKNIPEYCYMAFVCGEDFEPDGRMKPVKSLRASGQELLFGSQEQKPLFGWIARRFAANGKKIGTAAMTRLVSVSGEYMNRLIPEIEKISAYARGEEVTVSDVDAVANRIPEAQVFDMINLVADKKYDDAFAVLSELLQNQENKPVAMISALGFQLRRIFGAKLMLAEKKTRQEISKYFNINFDFAYEKLIASAKKFSYDDLINGIEACIECEFRMKTNSADDAAHFRDALLALVTGHNI